jgi:methionyl-tRNA synthetase
MKKYYVTTPIYYINDNPHIGHVYTTMAADIMSRYRKSLGYDVFFLTGTDENAVKIDRVAKQKGMKTQDFVDDLAAKWKSYFADFGLEFNDFIRTTEPRHRKTVESMIKQLFDQGDVYKGKYEGWYCVPCETYFLEQDLKEGNCPDCGRPVERISEENYFFALSKYRDRLLKYYDEHPDFVLPKSRYNEVYSIIKGELKDKSFTRSGMEWGIKVPFDPEHVVYVWADALCNYITAIGYPDDKPKFEKFWPADVHLIGKDIIIFHCIIWPAMLMALGLPLPEHIFAHGWWTSEGKKMSKSVGNFVVPHLEVERIVESTGTTKALAQDAFRYFLFRELPFGEDGDYSKTNFETRFNADLANDLGNLLNRSLKMLQKNFKGIVPDGKVLPDIESKFHDTISTYVEKIENFQFSQALEVLWGYVNALNTSIEVNKPWELVKQGKTEELANLHYTLADGIGLISTLLAPFMPNTANELAKAVGYINPPTLQGIKPGMVKAGTQTVETPVMFPRIEKKQVPKEEPKPVVQPAAAATAPAEELIPIEEFQKFKFRIGKVLTAEKVKDADKLLKLTVDIGTETRTVVAGIAMWYNPEDLVGKSIVVVANLKPAKLRGIMSEGMLMAATGSEYVAILSPEKPVEPGSIVK